MLFLLDSDIIGYLGDQSSPYHALCVESLLRIGENDEVCVSLLTVYEMSYSIAVASDPIKQEILCMNDEVRNNYRILPLSLPASDIYGQLKGDLKIRSGAKPKAMKGYTVDIILAATALENDAVLVSNDGIFERLQEIEPKLKVENWAN